MNKFVVLFLFAWVTVFAAKSQIPSDTATVYPSYKLQYEFAEKSSTTLDSTFIVYCVIDAKEFKDFDKMNVKTGKSTLMLMSREIKLNDKTKITKAKGKLKIELGKTGEDLRVIEIAIHHKNGKLYNLNGTQQK